jgi:hypothetical protein
MFALSRALCLLLLSAPQVALCAEPIEVWLTPPSILNAREIGARVTAASQAGLKESEARWRALGVRDVSYVLDQFTTGILFADCDMEPVSVRIVQDKVVAATYASGSEICKKGVPAIGPRYSQKIPKPDDLFEIVKHTIKENPECGVKVTYDPATGLPVLIEGGCWYVIDSYWSIKITDIVVRS